jgi:hypothetical protein
MLGSYWVAAQLAASREGLSSIIRYVYGSSSALRKRGGLQLTICMSVVEMVCNVGLEVSFGTMYKTT